MPIAPGAGRSSIIGTFTAGRRRVLPYVYRDPVELLEDFYREVERILSERGAP